MLSRSRLVGLSFIRVSNSRSPNSPGEVFTRARIKFDESMRSRVTCLSLLPYPSRLVSSATVCKSAFSCWLITKLVACTLQTLTSLVLPSDPSASSEVLNPTLAAIRYPTSPTDFSNLAALVPQVLAG